MSNINEKTHLPLSLVIGALGLTGTIVFAWAVLATRLDASVERVKDVEVIQNTLVKQQSQISTQLAVIDAKQSTTIEILKGWTMRFLPKGDK